MFLGRQPNFLFCFQSKTYEAPGPGALTYGEDEESCDGLEDVDESEAEMEEEAEVVLTPPSNTDEEESPGGAKPRHPCDAKFLKLSRELNTPAEIEKRCLDSIKQPLLGMHRLVLCVGREVRLEEMMTMDSSYCHHGDYFCTICIYIFAHI